VPIDLTNPFQRNPKYKAICYYVRKPVPVSRSIISNVGIVAETDIVFVDEF
jgi:hypothetical protein